MAMDSENDKGQSVERIVLPSGKRIEVLRRAEPQGPPEDEFDATDHHGRRASRARGGSPEDPAAADSSPASDPHRCPDCDSELVYPVSWTAAGAERSRVELRCPNCERTDGALLDVEVAERFDEELERGSETLMNDLARLSEANMLEDLERFAAALRVDGVLPADF